MHNVLHNCTRPAIGLKLRCETFLWSKITLPHYPMDDGGDVPKNPNEMVGGSVLGDGILSPLNGKTLASWPRVAFVMEKEKEEKETKH
jgi:hypothetical protein